MSCTVLEDWRLPTLAEAIQPLPLAMQRLTAVFGMGTGRATAVLPPLNCSLKIAYRKGIYNRLTIKPHDRLVSVNLTPRDAYISDLSNGWSARGL